MSSSSSGPSPTESLFSAGVRTRGTQLPATTPDFERLDRRPEPWAGPVRALMDEWFSHLHADAQNSIRPRFTSPRRDAHLGAFHGLYQHELAVRGGYDDVDCDIGREDPQHLRPDLLLARAEDRCFVEVTIALGDDVVAPVERPRVQQLYDAIDRIRNRDFLLGVDVRGVGAATPGRNLPAARIGDDLGGGVDDCRQRGGGAAPASPVAAAVERWGRDGAPLRDVRAERKPVEMATVTQPLRTGALLLALQAPTRQALDDHRDQVWSLAVGALLASHGAPHRLGDGTLISALV